MRAALAAAEEDAEGATMPAGGGGGYGTGSVVRNSGRAASAASATGSSSLRRAGSTTSESTALIDDVPMPKDLGSSPLYTPALAGGGDDGASEASFASARSREGSQVDDGSDLAPPSPASAKAYAHKRKTTAEQILEDRVRALEKQLHSKHKEVESMQEAWRIQPDDLALEEFVARGSEGTVYRGTFRGALEVAVKTMRVDPDSPESHGFSPSRFAILQRTFPRLVTPCFSQRWAWNLIPAYLLCRSMTGNSEVKAMQRIKGDRIVHFYGARDDSAEDFSRLNALLFTATAWIFIPTYCFAVP